MKRVFTVVGARPQFIKAAVVSRAFRELPGELPDAAREFIIHTGQHYDHGMSDVFFDELDIPKPDFHLGVGGGTHGQNTGRMIEKIEQILLEQRPDVVLVYGDTDSTLAGAVAAAKLHIPVAHVEAGLRSHNRRMPEELNRILTDHASDLLFTPTDLASRNLAEEGIPDSRVEQVGDVMYDAALFYADKLDGAHDALARVGVSRRKYVLATIHRAENTDDLVRMQGILVGLATSSLPVVLPIHPRTRKRIADAGMSFPSNVKVVDPIGYLEMVALERSAVAIVTDSGGVQKEAYFHGVPCITARDETEWVELVEAGVNRLVGANAESIAQALAGFRPDVRAAEPLYGDGNAGIRIRDSLLRLL